MNCTLLLLPLFFGAALASAAQPSAAVDDAPNTSGVPIPPKPTFDTSAAAVHGQQIAAYADRFDAGWFDEVIQGNMTLIDAGGDSVERTFTRMSLEDFEKGDKLIVRFLSPAEIKGVAALTHEHPKGSDDNWLYLPANKRVLRISGANKTASFQGTEFTYEDLSSLEVSDYDWNFLEETKLERDGQAIPVYKLDAKPTYEDTGYSHIVVQYSIDGMRRERVEYFDKAGQLLKTLDSSGWELHHGRFWRAERTAMVNHQTGKQTLLMVQKVFLNLSLYKSSRTGEMRSNLDESRFTTQALEL